MRFVITLLALVACSKEEAPVAHDTDKKEEVKVEAPAAEAAAAPAEAAAPAAAPAEAAPAAK